VARPGFTLIELLVVMAIIGILAALTASATMKIVGVQENKTTETNLLKLYALLDQQWKAVIAKANSDPTIPPFAYKLAGQDDKPSPPPSVERRARVMHIKLSLRQQFPVMFNELLGPNDMPGYPWPDSYSRAVNYIFKNKIFTNKENTEKASSVLLYLALSQSRSGVTMNADSILNSMQTQPIANAAGASYPDAKVIVDSWGNPIVFSRWPYQDPELNPAGAQDAPPWRDPEDPNGLLSDPWVGFPSAKVFDSKCYPVVGNLKKSFKLVPVLMSWGPDKEHGLDVSDQNAMFGGSKNYASLKPDKQNPDPAKANGTNDNVYSYRLRLGGSGN
jgi:prepilin-type N-terminal cleavage/methylation domain-containing protein